MFMACVPVSMVLHWNSSIHDEKVENEYSSSNRTIYFCVDKLTMYEYYFDTLSGLACVPCGFCGIDEIAAITYK